MIIMYFRKIGLTSYIPKRLSSQWELTLTVLALAVQDNNECSQSLTFVATMVCLFL